MPHTFARHIRGGDAPPRETGPGPAARSRAADAAPPGWATERHALLDSTNARAHRRIAAGLAGKTAILADCQTAGCGRGSRVWESATDKGLWASLVLPVCVPDAALAQSTLVLAVAVREAVERGTNVSLQTKWPNDLLHAGRKCCGLLVEAGIAQAAPDAPRGSALPLVLGIGLNVNHLDDDFPAFLRETATSLRLASGREYGRDRILAEILGSVDQWFARWTEQGFAPVRDAWLACNCTMGRRLVLPGGYGFSHGTARDLAPDGALVVAADNGAVLHVDAGEIAFTNAPPLPS